MFFPTSIYPKAHNPISVDWVGYDGGGIRAYAYTSDMGEPFIAIAGFNQDNRHTALTIVEQASHYRGKAILGDGSFAYRVPYFVIVSSHELLLYVEPPKILGMTDVVVSTPWGRDNHQPRNFDFLVQPDFPLSPNYENITRRIRELAP